MGALATKALRPIKSFNIENRAHRVISKEKPTPAPRYPTNIEDLKRTLEADPNIDEKLDRKDEKLDDRLKEVYVTSLGRPEDDITREKIQQSKTRPLPVDRKMPPDYEFGFKESDRVPYGKTTLRDAINFISAHQTDPKQVTATEIALKYKLKEEDVENILKYFKTYEIYLPHTKTSKAVFAGPATLRKELYKQNVKQIAGTCEGSLGAASLGANRDAPMPRMTSSVRSDERPLATQGDMLNSIKFERRFREALLSERPVFEKNWKPGINNTTSKTSNVNTKLSNLNIRTNNVNKPNLTTSPSPVGNSRDDRSRTRSFSPSRPMSPKGRRNQQTSSFY